MKDKQLIEKAYTTPKQFAECIDTIFSNNVDKIANYFDVKPDRDNISVDMLMEWLVEDGANYSDFIGFLNSFYEELEKSQIGASENKFLNGSNTYDDDWDGK